MRRLAWPTGGLWRHPDFLKLWSAETVSQFGTQVSLLALPLAAIIVLDATAFQVAALGTVEFLPFILFTLPAGVWVDRLPRRPILIAGDFGRAALLASIPLAYLTGTFQHIGSRFTQVGDEDLGTLSLPPFGSTTPGFPYNASVFTYDPELAAYDLVNARVGVRREKWDVALYANNLTDERAFLSLDRERGTRARIGYLTNQPRTFGITLRFNP